MASLSGKTDQQISDLLDEYEIRHGPVVGEWTEGKLYLEVPGPPESVCGQRFTLYQVVPCL